MFGSLSLWGPGRAISQDTLRRTEYAQPAILATSYALFLEAQKKMTGPPVALLGHSLGHYTALVCCGVLSFDDAISLVHRRGLLMSRVCSGLPFETAMAAVRPQSLVLETLPASLDVASHNSGQQLVVSGPKQDIMRLKRKKFLNVSAPFHSRYMENAAREYRKELEATTFRFAAVQEWPLLISNVTAQPVAMNRDSVVQDLTKQMCSTVQWYKSLDYVGKTLGVKDFVVFGPGETMSKFLCQSLPDSHLLSEYY